MAVGRSNKQRDCIVVFGWKRRQILVCGTSKIEEPMKIIGFERSKSEKAWLYRFGAWTPMITLGFGESKSQTVDCSALLVQNLWKP